MNREVKNGPMQFHQGTEYEMLKYVLENATDNDPKSVIETIDKFCWDNHWMMHVGDEKGKILCDEVAFRKPKNILELGTYCGYSTIRMLKDAPSECKVYTIDPNVSLINNVTVPLVKKAGLLDRVVFLGGLSGDVISTLDKSIKFDLVFFDHAKDAYYEDLLQLEKLDLLNKPCSLVADNVIVFKINNYLNHVQQNENLETTMYHTNLEYDHGKYKDGVVISRTK